MFPLLQRRFEFSIRQTSEFLHALTNEMLTVFTPTFQE
jgi:hypothetical protein